MTDDAYVESPTVLRIRAIRELKMSKSDDSTKSIFLVKISTSI
jgi:hypothetical protein